MRICHVSVMLEVGLGTRQWEMASSGVVAMLLRIHHRRLLLRSDERRHVRRLATAARKARFQRSQVLRSNRKDPNLEKAARLRKLCVPLGQVQDEWLSSANGQQQLQGVAKHFALDRDMLGAPPKQTLMTIVYETTSPVHFGNVLTPLQTQERPTVGLPEPENYWTLTLTSPDNYLAGKGQELLHWMVVNMTTSNWRDGVEVVPYLPPLPLKGTGLHRFVFTLFSHQQELSQLPHLTGSWVEQRSHCTQQCLSLNNGSLLQIRSFRFFQSVWDKSVREVFSKQLNQPEPEYDLRVA